MILHVDLQELFAHANGATLRTRESFVTLGDVLCQSLLIKKALFAFKIGAAEFSMTRFFVEVQLALT